MRHVSTCRFFYPKTQNVKEMLNLIICVTKNVPSGY